MVTPSQGRESLGDPSSSHSQGASAKAQACFPITLCPAEYILPGPSSVCPAPEPLHMLFPFPRMFWMYSWSGWYLDPLTVSLHLLRKAVPDPHLK